MADIDNLGFNFLVAFHCMLNDTSGTSVSAVDATGTYVGGITFSQPSLIAGHPDEISTGFDGSTAYADIVHESWFELISDFTIYSVFKPTSITGSRTVLESDTYKIWLDAGVIKFRYLTSGPTTHDLSSGVTAVNGIRYAVFVVHTGTLLKIYVNGVLKASVTPAGTILTPTSNPQIGRTLAGGGSQYFQGYMRPCGVLQQPMTDAEVLQYTDYVQAVISELTESLNIDDTWTEQDYVGTKQVFNTEDNLFIDFDWFETVYAGLPQSQTAEDFLDVTENIGQHGTFRYSTSEHIDITQSIITAQPHYQSLHQTITLTESMLRFGTARPINEQILEFDETLIVQGQQEFYISERLNLNETVRLQGLPIIKTITDNSLVLNQTIAIEWGVANIAINQTITLIEKLGLRLSIWSPIITEVITFTEQVHRVRDINLTDTIVFIDNIAKRVFPITKTDAIILTQAIVMLKVRSTKDLLVFFEDVCSKNTFNRSVGDQLVLTDRVRVFGRDLDDNVNNPLFVGWIDLAESSWNTLSNDQWNNLLYSTPKDNTGTIILPYRRAIKIKQHITLTERLIRFGGRAHCDPATITVVSVQKVAGNNLLWTFSGGVTASGGAATALQDSSLSSLANPIGTVQSGPNAVLCTYGATPAIGNTWVINTPPLLLSFSGPFSTPVSGLVT